MSEGLREASGTAPHRLSVELRRPGFSLEIDLEWSERVMVLFGPSGSGKSTLLEAALGLIPEARTRFRLDGSWLANEERGIELPTQARRLGWVPQDPTLFPHLDVLGNIRFGLGRTGDEGRDPLERAIEVLEIGSLLERGVDELSGGEKQRVALARAIASGPRALLLDEPLAALDLPLRSRVLPYLLRVRDELALPMLYITHDPDEAMLLGERVAVLDEGRLVATGPPRDVLWSREVLPLAETLGLENVFEATACGASGRIAEGPGDCRVETKAGLTLHVPWSLDPGSPLCLGLRAEDIMIAIDPPGRISARNVIPGRVSEVEAHDDHVLVHVDAGDRITTRVTPSAATSLGLGPDAGPGKEVFLIVKAHALRRLG